MRLKHRRIILLIQLLIVGVLVFVVSGIIGLTAFILGEISISGLLSYFEGLLTGESLIIGGTFLKMRWKKIIDDFWDWIEGNDDSPPEVSTKRISELKKLLRK